MNWVIKELRRRTDPHTNEVANKMMWTANGCGYFNRYVRVFTYTWNWTSNVKKKTVRVYVTGKVVRDSLGEVNAGSEPSPALFIFFFFQVSMRLLFAIFRRICSNASTGNVTSWRSVSNDSHAVNKCYHCTYTRDWKLSNTLCKITCKGRLAGSSENFSPR